MKAFTDYTKVFIAEMAGWICLIMAVTACLGVLLQRPIDTQFFTLTGNLLMAYVVQGLNKVLDKTTKEKNDKSENSDGGSSVTPRAP